LQPAGFGARQSAGAGPRIKEDPMSDLKARFEQAAQEVQQLPKRPENDTLLRLYALYKQGTAGDVSGTRPGILDMMGRLKYDAWAKVKGTAGDQAMTEYIALVEELKGHA
jgi:diazepam-binding inhibitor (GABA receptor modulating acyl-CoA-binding protein)